MSCLNGLSRTAENWPLMRSRRRFMQPSDAVKHLAHCGLPSPEPGAPHADAQADAPRPRCERNPRPLRQRFDQRLRQRLLCRVVAGYERQILYTLNSIRMPSTFDSVYDISYWPTHPGYLINKDIY